MRHSLGFAQKRCLEPYILWKKRGMRANPRFQTPFLCKAHSLTLWIAPFQKRNQGSFHKPFRPLDLMHCTALAHTHREYGRDCPLRSSFRVCLAMPTVALASYGFVFSCGACTKCPKSCGQIRPRPPRFRLSLHRLRAGPRAGCTVMCRLSIRCGLTPSRPSAQT